MTIVVTGGGSGGHITPILAVAHELKRLQPGCTIIYVGQTGDPFGNIPSRDPNINAVYTVSAGKFRRYYGEGLMLLLDFKTMRLNIRDGFRLLHGIWQARRLFRSLRPDVVFSRGGYVSVPVALGARAHGIPYITHDSDAIPSLANRLIARNAARNAVAMPATIYPYDQSKTVTVGVPVMAHFVPVTVELQATYRQRTHLPANATVLFATGGGLGAQRINDALLSQAVTLFARNPDLFVVHQAGQAHFKAVQAAYAAALSAEQLARVRVFGYMDNLYLYSGAADLVLARAGASSIADLAVQGKAVIIVPSPFLTGGHQLKNAAFLTKHDAAEILDESAIQQNPELLTEAVTSLLHDAPRRAQLAAALATYGHRDSATQLAQLVLDVGGKK